MEQNEISVNFHPMVANIALSGEILAKWNELDAQKGILGYPTAPLCKYKEDACAMAFQNGRICFSPKTGTHFITGKFYRFWADKLGINGKYGYPVSDPYEKNGIILQDFQGGTLSDGMKEIKCCVDLRGEIARRGIAIRNQGTRGTCSVQVMVFLLEYLYTGLLGNEYSHLSVEFSNHTANVATGTNDDGHCFFSMEAGYDKFGIILESMWPYNKDWVYDYEQAQTIVTADMLNSAKRMIGGGLRLKGRFIKLLGEAPGLTDAQFDELIAMLDAGIPVGVGRDHSLVAIGYERDSSQPGGGTIMFRNSWGTNPDFTGYQIETFENVIQTVNDLYVYTV